MLNPKSKKIVSNPKEIADTFSDYYEALYNLKDDPKTAQPTDEIISDQVSQEDLSTLNRPFTIPKIEKTIRSMPHNKSPGPDGYSSGYY